ncbi:MAG: type II secretion system protein GspG [Kiritimatiellia bacterium]
MIKYRCPYCKQAIQELLDPKCPHCGRVMALRNAIRDKATAKAVGEKHRARHRALERIRRNHEHQKQALYGQLPPSLFRSPTFYMGVMVVFVLVGVLLFNAADKSSVRQKESPHQRAMRHVDVLAEALGRYHFHVGAYPTADQGLAALVRDPGVPRWLGPYINLLRNDPWDTPFVYEPGEGQTPIVLSCGADKQRGTADDILPDPASFNPGSSWTNEWVSAEERLIGVTVLSGFE